MKRQNVLSITQLNLTLSEEAQIQVVSFEDFKKLHKEHGTKFERMIANIDYIKRIQNGYEFGIYNIKGKHKKVEVFNNGTVSINDSWPDKLYDYASGHLRININNNSILVEKMILTCEAILNDELPSSFKNLCVNCKNGCGSVYTANALGLQSDYSLDNLEWTLSFRNLIHGRYIKKVYEVTNMPYKFSANDYKLFEILALNNDEEIKKYLEENYLAD